MYGLAAIQRMITLNLIKELFSCCPETVILRSDEGLTLETSAPPFYLTVV